MNQEDLESIDLTSELKRVREAQAWAVRTLIGAVITVVLIFICAAAGTIVLSNGNKLQIENLAQSLNEFKADIKVSLKDASTSNDSKFRDYEARLRAVEMIVTMHHGSRNNDP